MAINIHAIVKVDLQKQKKIHLDKSKASVMKLNFLTFGKEWCIAWKRKKRIKKEREVAQSCPTLCNPMDYSLPGSSVHGIFQARVLEWVAISFSKIVITAMKNKANKKWKG